MNMFKIGFIVILFFLLLVGCKNQETKNEATESKDIAEQYLEEQGYKVLSHEESLVPYTLKDGNFENDESPMYGFMMVRDSWMFRDKEFSEYKNSKIYNELFIVTNHPLDNFISEGNSYKSIGETYVTVMVTGGEVIGGVSRPVLNKDVAGGHAHSLDGKSFEEFNPDKTWSVWTGNFQNKYINHIDYDY